MRLSVLSGVMLTALAASGCAVAPQGRGDTSVTHDVADYLHREWPLSGPPVIPADAQRGSCSCCGGGSGSHDSAANVIDGCDAGSQVWQDDWDQPGCLPHAKGYTDDPPPAVPLEPGLPGRFFPVPVRPAFAPQGATGGGFAPMLKAAG